MNDEIIKLCKELMSLYEKAYYLYEPRVNLIIENKITDINYIENTLDYVMDIYTEKGFNLFLKLLLYYSTVNYNNAKDYLEIFKEQREEEYSDFIKEQQKKLRKK